MRTHSKRSALAVHWQCWPSNALYLYLPGLLTKGAELLGEYLRSTAGLRILAMASGFGSGRIES